MVLCATDENDHENWWNVISFVFVQQFPLSSTNWENWQFFRVSGEDIIAYLNEGKIIYIYRHVQLTIACNLVTTYFLLLPHAVYRHTQSIATYNFTKLGRGTEFLLR